MAEYIEKKAAIDNIEKSFDKETILNRFVRKIAISAVGRMEPADVRPVARGRWSVAIGYDPKRAFQCSECHRMTFEPSNYCPNCGSYNGGDADG